MACGSGVSSAPPHHFLFVQNNWVGFLYNFRFLELQNNPPLSVSVSPSNFKTRNTPVVGQNSEVLKGESSSLIEISHQPIKRIAGLRESPLMIPSKKLKTGIEQDKVEEPTEPTIREITVEVKTEPEEINTEMVEIDCSILGDNPTPDSLVTFETQKSPKLELELTGTDSRFKEIISKKMLENATRPEDFKALLTEYTAFDLGKALRARCQHRTAEDFQTISIGLLSPSGFEEKWYKFHSILFKNRVF